MSSIAYVTDSKLLDMHRLNANKQMNFWRLSNKTSFSDFEIGDLVFFLSKDKKYLSGEKEKGIVGFGRVKKIIVDTPKKMWKKYEKENGYNSYEEFVEAILKVSKNHELPQTISSFYLDEITFLQSQLYLSEYGLNISKNVESYIYLDDSVVIKILEDSKRCIDIWSSNENQNESIDKLEIDVALGQVFKQVGEITIPENKLKKAQKEVLDYLEKTPIYTFIKGSKLDLYFVYENNITILLYNNKDIKMKEVIGQAILYKKYIRKCYPHPLNISFKTIDENKEIREIIEDLY